MARRTPEPVTVTSETPTAAISYAREVLETEAAAIRSVIGRLGPSFDQAVEIVLGCKGRLVVTGMGKAGFIAQKLSATFASTGTPSHYVHPAEALHGDLGRVTRDDVLIAFSNSGETDEITRLLPALKRLGLPIIAITGHAGSSLGNVADAVLDIGDIEEACPMRLAPTASAVAMLAMGDALAMSVLRERPFTLDDYAATHPGGKLGQKLLKVGEVMRKGPRNPMIADSSSVIDAIGLMTLAPGRPGATSIIDGLGRLVGIFTDGDLRRLIQKGLSDFTGPVTDVMTRGPRTVRAEMLVLDAAQLMREKEIDQVPVVDEHNRPVGLLDVQDLLAARILGES
jgi:arabinose-5-phosphate isomerase